MFFSTLISFATLASASPSPNIRFLEMAQACSSRAAETREFEITGLTAMTSLFREAILNSETEQEFLDMLQGVLIPNSVIPKPVLGMRPIPISRLQQEHGFRPPGLYVTGWKQLYWDSLAHDALRDDQAHHFLAFVIFGLRHGYTLAALAAEAYEARQPNPGDVALGKLGARFGEDLKKRRTDNLSFEHRQRELRQWTGEIESALSDGFRF